MVFPFVRLDMGSGGGARWGPRISVDASISRRPTTSRSRSGVQGQSQLAKIPIVKHTHLCMYSLHVVLSKVDCSASAKNRGGGGAQQPTIAFGNVALLKIGRITDLRYRFYISTQTPLHFLRPKPTIEHIPPSLSRPPPIHRTILADDPPGRHRSLSAHDSHDYRGGSFAGGSGPARKVGMGDGPERRGGSGDVG